MTAIELEALCFRYPDHQLALDHVDLVVERGERVALLGPNGAGKTTLMLHLNGVLTPSSGSVTICDLPVTKKHPEIDSGPMRRLADDVLAAHGFEVNTHHFALVGRCAACAP